MVTLPLLIGFGSQWVGTSADRSYERNGRIMNMWNLFNLIPLVIIGMAFFLAFTRAMGERNNPTTRYFKVEKLSTGKKFRNWFGIVRNM
jgi:hypothetical protein